ncbi:hypothetical protein [Pedobacter borealis]|uniref:hypothetical protein n=1 Tax=Pedobacter borealis TaxID=475254 RepID=UPI0004939E9C|nr:hypothetical protein [Pedobacter borealis]
MESKKTSTIFEHREYFYAVKSILASEIILEMYSTTYVLVKDKDGEWVNHQNNRYQLGKGLLASTIAAIGA